MAKYFLENEIEYAGLMCHQKEIVQVPRSDSRERINMHSRKLNKNVDLCFERVNKNKRARRQSGRKALRCCLRSTNVKASL